MEKLKEELLKRLSDGVVEMEEDDVEDVYKRQEQQNRFWSILDMR